MPQRRCAGCGEVRGKGELVRLALLRGSRPGAERIVLDRFSKMPGRGAYLCAATPDETGERAPIPGCLDLAVRRGGVSRTLRTAAKLEQAGLAEKPATCDLVESVSR